MAGNSRFVVVTTEYEEHIMAEEQATEESARQAAAQQGMGKSLVIAAGDTLHLRCPCGADVDMDA